MKSLLKLVDSLLGFFRPKPRYISPQHGLIITECLDIPEKPYCYSVGNGGSGDSISGPDSVGVAGNSNTDSSNSTHPGDPRGGYGCGGMGDLIYEFPNVTPRLEIGSDGSLLAYPQKGFKWGKSKKKKTKKKIATENAKSMLEILKWVPSGLTAYRFQKASQVRRDRFLPLLKKLVKNNKISRTGSGKSGDPYRYSLPKKKA
jgi:hypothetical protein